MIKQMSIAEIENSIASLENTMKYEDTISVTDHGKEVLAILRWDTYEGIMETLDILSDPESYNDLNVGIVQAQEGNLIDLEEVRKNFGV